MCVLQVRATGAAMREDAVERALGLGGRSNRSTAASSLEGESADGGEAEEGVGDKTAEGGARPVAGRLLVRLKQWLRGSPSHAHMLIQRPHYGPHHYG